MTRQILSLVVIALVTAAVGAQQPKALTNADKGQLFKKNREVIEKIIDQTVESSKSPNDPLKRATTYYSLVVHFNKEISAARRTNDNSRISELAKHLTTLLKEGLIPTLARAKSQTEGGTGMEEFKKIRIDLLAQLDVLLDLLGNDAAARNSLEGAKDGVNAIVIPEK